MPKIKTGANYLLVAGVVAAGIVTLLVMPAFRLALPPEASLGPAGIVPGSKVDLVNVNPAGRVSAPVQTAGVSAATVPVQEEKQ